MESLRVLLMAEAANPQWVSVPLVGWSHCRAIAARTDAHLVTQVRNRPALLEAGLREGEDFTAIDSERLARPMHRAAELLRGGANKGWTTAMAVKSLSYWYFEKLVWKRFGDAIRAGRYDVVHRVTPLSPTTPSLVAPRCRAAGVPFVLGPLNGGLPWPRGHDYLRRREREWLSYVREAHRLLPGYRATRRAASALLAGSRHTLAQVPERYREKTVYVPENAIDPERFEPGDLDRPGGLPLRMVFVGRLVPYKAADLLIESIAPAVRAGQVELEIIGDGPERPRLAALIERLGVSKGVRLVGWVAHEKLQERLREMDVLGFPSLREFGGGVVLEAMALGLAPLVVDYGGPGELVTSETGVAVPMGRREEILARLREAVSRLVSDPRAVREMGRRARERVMRHFTWSAKADQTLAVYRWVTGSGRRPDFGMPLGEFGSRAAARAEEVESSR
ncbi:MAG: glycosyltransferase family 4 protein [Phycisphaeraceae bacterium]